MLPFELTKDTPYLALSGELWSVFYEYLNRNWSCYKGFLLYLVATCPRAISHPDMAFGLFSGRQLHECLEWIPIGSFSIDHTLTMDNSRFVARIQNYGNNFGGYQGRIEDLKLGVAQVRGGAIGFENLAKIYSKSLLFIVWMSQIRYISKYAFS